LYAGPLEEEEAILEGYRLIEATGAREYVVALAQAQDERAVAALNRVAALPHALAPLRHLAELLTQRDY
ncbi:MAG: hypothetical protein H0T73_05495, partial [Ardenticatenales bacterium]|nr:hypothetical protein [Ardenticatenales bacterium]